MIEIYVKDMRFPLLLDAYGVLLTERKRELLDYYYNEDCSLSEISELTGLTRQGVRDGIRKAEEELRTYEEKLGFVRFSEAVADVAAALTALADQSPDQSPDGSADALRKAAARLFSLRPADPDKE